MMTQIPVIWEENHKITMKIMVVPEASLCWEEDSYYK